MMQKLLRILLVLVVIVITGLSTFPRLTKCQFPLVGDNDRNVRIRDDLNKVENRPTNTHGTKEMIVNLRVPFQFEDKLSPNEILAQRENIHNVRKNLLSNLAKYNVRVVSNSDQWAIPSVALQLDSDAINYLTKLPLVESLEENTAMIIELNLTNNTKTESFKEYILCLFAGWL